MSSGLAGEESGVAVTELQRLHPLPEARESPSTVPV